MKTVKNDIQKMSTVEIKTLFSSILNKIFKKYSYALLTEEENDSLSIDAINILKNSELKETDTLEKSFEIILNKVFKDYIFSKLIDKEYALRLVKYFVEKNISFPTNAKEAIKNISRIVKFISRIGYNESFDLYENLIKGSIVVKNNLDCIYSSYKYMIENDKIDQILSLKEISLLEAYLVCENIDIENLDEINETILSDSVISADSLKSYMIDMGQVAILTKQEEAELGKKILEGNLAQKSLDNIQKNSQGYDKNLMDSLTNTIKQGKLAEKKMVEANLRLVIAIAKKYKNNGMDLLDLIQEGNIGLMKAARLYDISKGYRFTTYAIWWIKSFICRYISDNCRNIKIPIYQNEKLNRIHRAQKDLLVELQREPTKKDLAARLNMSEDEIATLLSYEQSEVSINTKIYEDENAELGDFIVSTTDNPEEESMDKILCELVRNLLDTVKLSEKEKAIIIKRYGLDGNDPCTLERIAADFDVTRERIRQIETKALAKLRKNERLKGLSAFLDNPEVCDKTIQEFKKTGFMLQSAKKYDSSGNFYAAHQAKRAKSIREMLDKYDFELVQITCNDILSEEDWGIIEKRYGTRDITVKGKNRLNDDEKNMHIKILVHLRKELARRTYYIEHMNGSIYDLYPDASKDVVDFGISKLSPDKTKFLEKRFQYDELTNAEKSELFQILNCILMHINKKNAVISKIARKRLFEIKNKLINILTTEEAIFVISGMKTEHAYIVCLYEGFNTLNRKFSKNEIEIILGISKDEIHEKITEALKEFTQLLEREKGNNLAKRYIKNK